MENFIAIIFDTVSDANEGIRQLWELDAQGEVTVHGAAVVRRHANGFIQVATQQTDIGVEHAVGVGVGALIGALARPTQNAESPFILPRGKVAVLANVTENATRPIDALARRNGAMLFRRWKKLLQNDQWDWDYADYLYPYEFKASFG